MCEGSSVAGKWIFTHTYDHCLPALLPHQSSWGPLSVFAMNLLWSVTHDYIYLPGCERMLHHPGIHVAAASSQGESIYLKLF